MNIRILHSHLLEHLNTKASPEDIAKYLSLCGPSVESVRKIDGDYIYDIEVTTNRVDIMSSRGIAREAAAILPRFDIKASLKEIDTNLPRSKTPLKLTIKSDPNLVRRILAIALTDIKNTKSPSWMIKRLEAAGIRSLNAVVDITNYVMLDLGHPTHVFDYNKLLSGQLIVRESNKKECLIGLDNKTYTLKGGDIVFDNGQGSIIDLPGVLGTKNTVVDDTTKSILFFVDNIDPVHIRKTSMSTGIRTMAAIINEKGVDPYLGQEAIIKGVHLYQEICGATIISKIYDNFPKPPKKQQIKVDKTKIDQLLGVNLPKANILNYLTSLGFLSQWNKDTLLVTPPTWRTNDVKISEDVIEEIARIEGYHNLPSLLMAGLLPEKIKTPNILFNALDSVKQELQKLGGIEVYTLALVGKVQAGNNAVKLKNPLGSDTEYMRTSLKPSLQKVLEDNLHATEPFHIFEIANIYHKKAGDLPTEELTLAGIIKGHNFRVGKGILEHFLGSQFSAYSLKPSSKQALTISVANEKIGTIDATDTGRIYYELNINQFLRHINKIKTINDIPKHPPHIEDITINLPENHGVGEILEKVLQLNKLIKKVELIDIYRRAHTLRLYFQHPEKTLDNKEVARLRALVEKTILHPKAHQHQS